MSEVLNNITVGATTLIRDQSLQYFSLGALEVLLFGLIGPWNSLQHRPSHAGPTALGNSGKPYHPSVVRGIIRRAV